MQSWRHWHLAIVIVVLGIDPGQTSAQEPTIRKQSDSNQSFLDNGQIRLGVDLSRGGSIGYLADAQTGENVVNVHDFGRWIGQSYYAGPKPFGMAHPAWKDWPWNPVSAGDVYGHASEIVETTNDGKVLYVKSIPRQWALRNVAAECIFETWISLSGRTAQVRNRLTNRRSDQITYPALDQELPALYTIGKLHRLLTYTGDDPFTDQATQEIPKKPAVDGRPHWNTFFATEHWAALVDEHDWGLGLIHPGVVRFLGGFYGSQTAGGPRDDSTGYLAPIRQEILDHNIVYEYRYVLVLDTLPNIRAVARQLRPEVTGPDDRFTHNRQHWWTVNVPDSGTPFAGHWHLQLERDDPQLIGPEGHWQARDVPRLFIRGAWKTRQNTAELFWETAATPGFSGKQTVSIPVIPDGQMRTYEVHLAQHPQYRGVIRRLRFDPVAQGHAGDTVDLEFVSAKPK
ncbi:MAG: hypothetical protein JSS02_00210 [Planctomycetes bacterium]|nr:hypothetical protein [Planctomycetota bacterium]